MEGLLCKSASAEIQNELVNLSVDTEVLLGSEAVSSSKNFALDKDENLEAQQETKVVNGHIRSDSDTADGESPNLSESVSQKSFSPTLIGSAIQAMKNLFSPDKTKSKSVSVLTPINQQRNAGSPHKYISSKAEASSSEPTIEILNKVKFSSEEKKNLLQIPEVGDPQCSLTLEDQNNMDETFFTTVSLIDESFHSTVTHLDEHEALKSGTYFIKNIFNNSQNLELVDLYNETPESNESHLENTILTIGSFINEGNNAGGSAEKLNNTENSNFPNKNEFKDSEEAQDGILEENMPNGQMQTNELRRTKEEKNVTYQTPSETTFCLGKMNGDVADIFLNKSFEGLPSPQAINDIDINSMQLKEERDCFVQPSISTTTVVLNSNNSGTLMSLKSDELDCYAPSYTCIEEGVTGSVENSMMRKPPLSELHCKLPYKQSVNSCSYPATSFSPSVKENKSASEGNSPIHVLNLSKVKLNKSDELINRRILCEPLEGKWAVQEKNSSVDITLIKNVEASKMIRESGPFGKETQAFKERQSEFGEDESSVRPNSVAVISQQSYTILSHDNRLNRPVIEPINTKGESSEKQTFQMIQSVSTEVETSLGKNCKNTSFSTDDSVKSPEPKQSTPLWEGKSQNIQKNFRPTVLKHPSPDSKKHVHCDAKETRKNISIHSHPLEISPIEPINDHVISFENQTEGNSGGFEVKGSKVLLTSGESSKGFDMKKRSSMSRRSEEKSPSSLKTNQTFDKKHHSGKNQESHKLNHTFRRKSLSPEGSCKGSHSPGKQSDAMFNKSSGSLKAKNLNSTFTIKTETGGTEKACQTFNIPASPEASEPNKTCEKSLGANQLNESFDKKTDLFVNKTQIINTRLESPGRNQTFTEENGLKVSCQGMEMQDFNITFDKNEMEEIPEESDANDSNESIEGNRTFRKPSGLQSCLRECEAFSASDSCNNFYDKSNKTSEESTSIKCDSFRSAKSSGSDVSTTLLNDKEISENQGIDILSEKLEKMDLAGISVANGVQELVAQTSVDSQNLQAEEKLLNSLKNEKLRCDPDLVQLIQEQFSPNDIEKICNVVQDLSSLKLSSDILQASEQFDKSFHGNPSAAEFKPSETVHNPGKDVNPLSPQSFDFLNSIEGKPTGRDLSRESLYVKFDPLVQPAANSLIDFTKEGEALAAIDASPPSPHSTSICEQLLAISPQKKPDEIVPPLTPLSHKVKTDLNKDKFERLKELQNEIYFLKNLYAERERTNKVKMEDYESQIAKLTGQSCFLTDKLNESNEREKALVKKMKEQTQGINQLKVIMEEYVKVISKLGAELGTLKEEYKKQVETLTQEKDSYMTHLQNTEAAFTDVHTKYEKSKKTIVSLKGNEIIYRNTIAEQAQKLEDFKLRTKEAQEKAVVEFGKIQEELSETKAGHAQETARLRAQLRKTELKVEALQESLDQKIKENQQLTAICDELIEGKK